MSRSLLLLIVLAVAAYPQQPSPTPEPDVVRIGTDLTQVGVTVLDSKGRRVDGLRKEDFTLTVDGKSVPVEFFESIATGSSRERSIVKTDAGAAAAVNRSSVGTSRTIIFFVDDNHLSLTSVDRTRSTINDFIDKQMRTGDLVAIASASGRIGFLQQFTDNKTVLKAAVARLGYVNISVADPGANPGAPMTEYHALSIERRDDPGLFDFYVQNCYLWAARGGSPQTRRTALDMCQTEVKNRARQIVMHAGEVTDATYIAFETLLKSAARMPGRKLAFFVSDGFLPETGPRGRVSRDRLGTMAARARAASVVIYSIDARGLVSGALDATGAAPLDPNGRLESANSRAIAISQDAMNALAVDTGGRALRNQNTFDDFVNAAVDETSKFYLLAWLPTGASAQGEKSKKIEIKIPSRPELTVLAAENSFRIAPPETAPSIKADAGKSSTETAEVVKTALADFLEGGTIPLRTTLTYLDTPENRTVLTTWIEIPAAALSFGADGKEAGEVTIAGVILDDRGKSVGRFGTGLKVASLKQSPSASDKSNVDYSYPTPVKPGIYQVRVAAVDRKSGAVGNSNRWIVVPDTASGELSVSSLFTSLDGANTSRETGAAQWHMNRILPPTGALNVLGFVYNAANGKGSLPDLEARTVILRGDQEVLASPFGKLGFDPKGDLSRIVFSGKVKLDGLVPGDYTLRLTVRDRVRNKEASQNVKLTIGQT